LVYQFLNNFIFHHFFKQLFHCFLVSCFLFLLFLTFKSFFSLLFYFLFKIYRESVPLVYIYIKVYPNAAWNSEVLTKDGERGFDWVCVCWRQFGNSCHFKTRLRFTWGTSNLYAYLPAEFEKWKVKTYELWQSQLNIKKNAGSVYAYATISYSFL